MTERPDSPWTPTWSPTDETRQIPLGAPPAAAPWPTAPPVHGGSSLPPVPPVPPVGQAAQPPYGGITPPPGGPVTQSSGRAPGKGVRGPVVAAVLVVAVFAAGLAGVFAGKSLAGDDSTSSASQVDTGQVQTVSTVPGPVASGQAEPVAAVAAALSPAVVQLETESGLGSGFIYDKSGLILTAAHVTDGASSVRVRMADGTSLAGRVLGSDDSTDVAVVKISGAKDLPVATLATGVALKVGQTAVAIGSPFGLDQTVTAGIVSAVGRSTETPGGYIPAVQTDAPINSGNSGGALADARGRVIGINDSIITGNSQVRGNVGVGFAIPIDLAKTVADLIVAGKPTEGGFLGVKGSNAVGSRAGAVITSVESGSPAAKGGLETGDVVVRVGSRSVQSMIDLAASIRSNRPGDTISLVVVRGGSERTVKVTLTNPPS